MREYNRFDWVDFYHELAEKLLRYKKNRKTLIDKVKAIYEETGLKMPKFDEDGDPNDFDPFTFFGLFNKYITRENRLKIISAVAKLFDVSAPIPTSFDGIPLLNNLNANFYLFKSEREKDDIDKLWEFFERALDYAKFPSKSNRGKVSELFDRFVGKKCNGVSKITMALFWIAPDVFLNLDSLNKRFIAESVEFPADLVKQLPKIGNKTPASDCFAFMDKIGEFLRSGASSLKDFKELSYAAFNYQPEKARRYWLYAPGGGAVIWDECYKKGIMAVGWDGIGDFRQYGSKTEVKKAMQANIKNDHSFTLACLIAWQFANEMKPGDVVFAKKGVHKILGYGIVKEGYSFDPSREHYQNIRYVEWKSKGEWDYPGYAPSKTLTDLTPYPDIVDELKDRIIIDSPPKPQPYNRKNFLNEVYMDEESYETLTGLILKKKNVILLGAPGVGKTFAAKRLAYSMIGVKDPERVTLTQFHQSYTYEDFIMGYRPNEAGFELKKGAFYNFCKKAEEDGDNEYFFIIDEINRGNLSKIFGELFMLIEEDKRGVELQLLYANEKFAVPKNVYIIGMMNTADRSLAMLDYALRRRFAFFEMKPAFDSEGFQDYRKGLGSKEFDRLIEEVKELNRAIAEDESLGEGFCVGHSYFCGLEDVNWQTLSNIVEYELVPLLKEYWFDEPKKANAWAERLRSAIK